ncbi:MAG: hypothetical protein RL653_4114 [Pseudomonadota bacterium]|jgi:hypothetical protein
MHAFTLQGPAKNRHRMMGTAVLHLPWAGRRLGGGLLIAALTACESQDASDQRAVRRLCGLPSEAEVVTWNGYPGRVGFGQREGLSVAGTFKMPAGWSAEASGYRAAPWPAAREAAEHFQLGSAVDGARALRCETAGNDVLRARTTRPCEGGARTNDLILCTVDGSGQVRAVVRSAY